MEPNIQDQPQQFKPTGAATSTARAIPTAVKQ